jgi:hypothetical protein
VHRAMPKDTCGDEQSNSQAHLGSDAHRHKQIPTIINTSTHTYTRAGLHMPIQRKTEPVTCYIMHKATRNTLRDKRRHEKYMSRKTSEIHRNNIWSHGIHMLSHTTSSTRRHVKIHVQRHGKRHREQHTERRSNRWTKRATLRCVERYEGP